VPESALRDKLLLIPCYVIGLTADGRLYPAMINRRNHGFYELHSFFLPLDL
jgi:hypothetical protein